MNRRKDNKGRVLKEGENQRKNGSYQFRWRSKNGKRHTIYAPTLEKLREKEIDVLKDTLDGIDVEAKQLTINDIYKKWVVLKKGLKTNTFENYKYMFEMYVSPSFGNTRITEVKKSDVRGFYNTLYEEKWLKPATIDSVHTVLHQVFEIAVDDGYIRANPSDKALVELKRLHPDNGIKKMALTQQQQRTLEEYLEKPGQYHHWYPLIITLLYTGMRIGEAAGLTWDDIDLEKELIYVNKTVVYFCSREEKAKHGHNKYAVNSPKTEAGKRTIIMLPIVKKAILMEKEYQEEVGLSSNMVIDGVSNFIFVNRFGDCHHQGSVNKALRRIIRDCNDELLDQGLSADSDKLLPHFSCHTFRHTFATRLAEASVSDKVRMDLLGHKDIAITQTVYTDAFEPFKRSELEKLKTLELLN